MTHEALRAGIRERLEAKDALGAWSLLGALESRLTEDPELAAIWMDLCRITPDRPGLRAEAEKVLGRWPDDPTLVQMACGALLAAAERRPMDEPPLVADGPAQLAARAALRCLEGLPEAARKDPEVAGYLLAQRGNALRLSGPNEDAAAQQAFADALALDREKGGWWFDLALLHKWRGRFQQGFECNLRAQARLGDTRAVLFNLGICATAIGDGNVAGLCWKKLGFPVDLHPKSGHAIVEDLPPMQIRVLSKGTGYGFDGPVPDQAVGFEVVWVQPLSPCHGVVATPTFREAPIDYGDVVLWDAAPVAVVQGESGPVPRFPLLEILRRGDEKRFRFVGLEQRQGDTEALAESLPEGTVVYVHEARVEHVCPTCASGDAWKKHEHLPPQETRIVYGKMCVPGGTSLADFRVRLEGVIGKNGRVQLAIPGLYELLGDSKRAGQEHQAWRGIERSAIKKGLV
ncbi:MAG: hypothetical protein U0230_07475 [Polyangiales bacterium]